MTLSKIFFQCGSLLGFSGVALGAFGAHLLKTRLSQEMLAIFETGVRYQIYHALALLAVAWAVTQLPSPLIKAAGWFFIVGTLIFSDSLYLLTLSGVRGWGAVTPLGGLLLLAGWFVLILSSWSPS